MIVNNMLENFKEDIRKTIHELYDNVEYEIDPKDRKQLFVLYDLLSTNEYVVKAMTDDFDIENAPNKVYLFEVWGAKGGSGINSEDGNYGGKGGYSYGLYTTNAPINLYVVVGQTGTASFSFTGGYNGGGSSLTNVEKSAGGGGATHIALKSGVLSSLINTPRDFKITVRDLKLSNGAGFIVAYCGNILTMPGLPKIPQAVKMEDL